MHIVYAVKDSIKCKKAHMLSGTGALEDGEEQSPKVGRHYKSGWYVQYDRLHKENLQKPVETVHHVESHGAITLAR